ncbi:MAG: lipoyl synthase [Mariprofundaceae bacterium]
MNNKNEQTVIPIQTDKMLSRPEPKPHWLKVKAPVSPEYRRLTQLMRDKKLNTVCEEASCPNIGECWKQGTATFMILGRVCTRTCAFCDVATGKPDPLNVQEPKTIAETVQEMGLKHVVITSVDRDDLADGGAEHYAKTIRAVKDLCPRVTIEVLTPDFQRKPNSCLDTVIDASPNIFNHNLETIPRLYRSVRPGARYFTSLRLLQRAKELDKKIVTKSGMMLGLGETRDEVLQVLDDLKEAQVDILTLGQYLRPSPKHHPVDRYWSPEEFNELKYFAESKGFGMVASGPLVRSSFHADEVFQALKQSHKT